MNGRIDLNLIGSSLYAHIHQTPDGSDEPQALAVERRSAVGPLYWVVPVPGAFVFVHVVPVVDRQPPEPCRVCDSEDGYLRNCPTHGSADWHVGNGLGKA